MFGLIHALSVRLVLVICVCSSVGQPSYKLTSKLTQILLHFLFMNQLFLIRLVFHFSLDPSIQICVVLLVFQFLSLHKTLRCVFFSVQELCCRYLKAKALKCLDRSRLLCSQNKSAVSSKAKYLHKFFLTAKKTPKLC